MLVRPKSSEGGPRLCLELIQKDGTTPETYPSIRFHHENRFWHRLEARANGLHVRDGGLGSDNYKSFHAGDINANGNMKATGSLDAASITAGDIKANSLHVATGPAERLRIVRGTVTASNTVADGSGFSLAREPNWLTKIIFNSAFASPPSIVVTQQHPDNNTSNDGGNTKDNAIVVRVDRYAAWVKCGDNDGDGSWRRFHFIAVGP